MRAYPHPIPDAGFREQADDSLRHLIGFRNVAETALERGAVDIVGDFAPIAMSLSYLAWLHDAPPDDVAARASDAVHIAHAAAAQGHRFKSPYDFWLLACWAVALDHPLAEDLLALPSEQWSATPTRTVIGLLPSVVEALGLLASGAGAADAVRRLQIQHRSSLTDEEGAEEALRFAPTVGALVALQTDNHAVWTAACQARVDGWKREAWRFPTATMFLLDAEWLAMMRLARQAGLPLPDDDVYRPHALLGASSGDSGTLGIRLGPVG